MKKFTLLILLVGITLLAFGQSEPVTPEKIGVATVIGVIAGIYEVLSRIVPTSKVWSITGKILEALTFLSNKLDWRKK